MENKYANKKILVADDEKYIVRLIEVNLKKAGYGDIKCVLNGKEAWEEINQGGYDMAILDIMMPHIDGFELIKKIRGSLEEKVNGMPVIFLTAKAQNADIFKGWEYKCDMYLTKPFNPIELLLVIERLFKEKENNVKE